MMVRKDLKFYNTQSRVKEVFISLRSEGVSVYVCGPTVYGPCHIGNGRPAVIFDVLRRLLASRFRLNFVSNLTDIDDKIILAAKEEGVSTEAIASKYIRDYWLDMKALGVGRPDIAPKASEHIAEMIAMISDLVANEHAYQAEGHVLFDVSSFASYGALSHHRLDEMEAGARVEVAPYKKNPSDFVLWKPSDEQQPGWASPWGRGRPGWHIECSAMIHAHLGTEIDIHAAGADLIFPHHENERAQSICVHGGKLARFWMHNALVIMGNDKMSKSTGNIVRIRDLLSKWPGEVLRLALLMTHYRQPLYWSEETPQHAERVLERWYRSLHHVEHVQPAPVQEMEEESNPIYQALADDLNTPQAITEISNLAKQINNSDDPVEQAGLKQTMLQGGALLGVLEQTAGMWFARGEVNEHIPALIAERKKARQAKDFSRADAIRDELAAMNVILEDKADETRWRYKNRREIKNKC